MFIIFDITLKKLREERNLSQNELAKIIGVTQSAIGNWESGTREPNFKKIQEIADFFNVSIDYMFGRSNPIENPLKEKNNEEQIENVLEKARALFFNDNVSEDDKERFFRDTSEFFWEAKEMNKLKKPK